MSAQHIQQCVDWEDAESAWTVQHGSNCVVAQKQHSVHVLMVGSVAVLLNMLLLLQHQGQGALLLL